MSWQKIDLALLKQLCNIHGPSGNEGAMKDFVLDYVQTHQKNWAVTPEIFHGEDFQDCVVLVFGQPKTAIFAHLDSIGFMVGYHRELVKIGGPRTKHGYELVGQDSQGPIDCDMELVGDQAMYRFEREIERGTELVFKCDFRESDNYVQSCYLDNRLGCWIALKTAETMENGIICFSCWEEQGGGSVPYLAKFIYEKYGVKQALITDITWVTEGIKHGKGVAISLKDKAIPRRSYTNRIRKLAAESGTTFQIEVEHAGGSDGIELQNSPYPFDWCFIGPPENHVHTPDEKVHKFDIQCTLDLYKYLMARL